MEHLTQFPRKKEQLRVCLRFDFGVNLQLFFFVLFVLLALIFFYDNFVTERVVSYAVRFGSLCTVYVGAVDVSHQTFSSS